MVAENQLIDLEEIRRWSKVEGKLEEFERILEKLSGLDRNRNA
jgi:hypothetical protein